MTICFFHNQKAFLPEIGAYRQLFEPKGITCKTALPQEADRMDTDVEWHFMGTDTHKQKEGRIKIHEYGSGSIAPFRTWKDFGKKLLNVKPDFRLFLNQYVNERFAFNDGVPFGYRDMGVGAEWLVQTGPPPAVYKYDFVYTGDLSSAREPEKLLNVFTNFMKDKTLLVISNQYARLQALYRSSANIIFKGPYEHPVIRSMLPEARYGINYIVDKEPFNRQTSTKFLEYAACGLPVVSTQYRWIEEFRSTCGGRYYYLNQDLSNFRWHDIENFNFSPPDLSGWTWEKQIERSGVLEFLFSRLP